MDTPKGAVDGHLKRSSRWTPKRSSRWTPQYISGACGCFTRSSELSSRISQSKVKVKVDNQSAVRIIYVGSMKPDLHHIAMDIFLLCLHNGISLETEWVPRDMNQAADAASREAALIDTDDWQLQDSFFQLLDQRFSLHNRLFLQLLQQEN